MSFIVDSVRPQQKKFVMFFDLLAILAGSMFLVLMAQISFPMGFSPVPFSMQTFGVLLLGALLGSRRASFSVLLYLAEGAYGFPVFASGLGGWAVLAGPRGGYLLGFVVAAFLTGFLLEKGLKKSYGMTFLAMLLGSMSILACGSLWLSFFVGYKNAFYLGIAPFIGGELLKVLMATSFVPTVGKVIKYINLSN